MCFCSLKLTTSIVLLIFTRCISLIIKTASRLIGIRFKSSSSVIEKYGRSTPVSVPLIKDVIDYPQPVINKHYEEVRRSVNRWASQYWADDRKLADEMLANDWPYFLSMCLAHLPFDLCFDSMKACLTFVAVDTKVENDYQTTHRRSTTRIMKRICDKLLDGDRDWESFASEIDEMDPILAMALDCSLMAINKYRVSPASVVDVLTKFTKIDIAAAKHISYSVSFDQFMDDRLSSFLNREGVFGSMSLAEIQRTGQLDVVDYRRLWVDEPEFRRYVETIDHIVVLANEIRSLPVEQTRDDHWGNGVTVLARHNGISLQKSVEMAIKILDNKITEFQTLGWHLLYRSDLAGQYPHLKEMIEIVLPNYTFGLVYYNDFMGKYRLNGSGTAYEETIKIGKKIDPELVFARVKR